MKTVNHEDIIKEIREEDERLARQIYIQDGYITINVAYEYNISLEACATHEALLGWVVHLSDKTWMDLDLMKHFIQIAAHANKLEIRQ
ncbi:hypothetical protein [Yersinia aldovae]|uniref:Uncharacterized protein n=1 Tax=Yersinia aldovae TaxID=29483 RepID=A0ABM9STG3_YERAL|nr:hypothetical protein [Yersinia aldovae]CNK98437.1 Uncharacterised protein [Yersinia aldovae]